MRLFLLPISTRRSLIYCQRLNIQLTSKQTYVEKVTARAGATWVKWESADAGWQKKLTVWGNELFKRIPYEEWGLKSIPPLSTRRAAEDMDGREETEVIYPSSVIKPGTVFDVLQKLATERQLLHRKRMWGSIIGMPITAPFGLIPILPNIPFFYLVWRAWSHWRALSGSKHIEHLLQKGLIKSAPSDILSRIYDLQADKSFSRDFFPHYSAFLQDWKMLQDRQIDKDKNTVDGMMTLSTAAQELVKDLEELLGRPGLGPNALTYSNNAVEQDEGQKSYPALPTEPTELSIQGLIARCLTLKTMLASLTLTKVRATTLTAALDSPDEEMLLTTGSGKLLADALQMRELEVEVDRAVEQVQKSLAAESEAKEEKVRLATTSKIDSKENETKE